MNRILIIFLILLVGLVSCKNSEKTIDRLLIAENYFVALDESNSAKMEDLLADSLIITIPKYEYKVRYSKNDYLRNWLKWDSVFEPTYKVLEMNMENGTVKANVSKSDKRIIFFMGKPFVTNEILRFKDDKIIELETEYINFDEKTWGKNRTELLNWTKENHPELNLDLNINMQTESGGKKFLKAIERYENEK
ncbi:nuclear transport factor 2-like protein [Nonlabens xiamenensis]|uniref:hypothetical protein n=1 Tax=Nonlabens xiamenensis TaxID=2341043 RepID=UPI000F6077BD|nr:hypothetical protein [Nonlabens xiamenensis]